MKALIIVGVIVVLVAIVLVTTLTVLGACKMSARADRRAELQRRLRLGTTSQTPDLDGLRKIATRTGAFGRTPEPGMPDGITWPGNCPACIWWEPPPAEAEDAVAVYKPCALHDPVLWAEMERRLAQ